MRIDVTCSVQSGCETVPIIPASRCIVYHAPARLSGKIFGGSSSSGKLRFFSSENTWTKIFATGVIIK